MGLLSSLFGGNKSEVSQQEKQDKKNFEVLKYDGIRARNMHQLPYAIRCFEQALALNEEPETLQLLAGAYVEAGRVEDARLTLDRLTGITPENVKVWLFLAKVCDLQEDYEGMDAACRKAIALDDKLAMAYYWAGKAAYALKDGLQSIVMLTKATVCNEKYKEAYLLRAEVLWEMRQIQDAMADVEKVLTLCPEEEEALLLMAKMKAVAGQAEDAGSCLDKVIEINPFNEKAYLLKSELCAEQKELDRAEAVCNEALELMPQNARIYQERGRIYLLKGEKDKSFEDMKKAIELNPDNEKQINGHYDSQSSSQATGIY